MAIRFGWLRALLFLVTYLVVLTGVSFIPAPDLYTGYTVSFLATIGLWAAFTKWIDRIALADTGLRWKGHGADALAGFALATALLGLGTSILLLKGELRWMAVEWNGEAFLLSLGLMALVAVAEELVFRGYVLRNLLGSFKAPIALLLSAALFAVFHAANPNNGFLPLLNVFLAGLLLGVNYIFTRNCWFGMALHFAWNFLQGPVLGYAVSGLELPSVLQQSEGNNKWLTGGAFGLEGSVLTTVLTAVSVVVLYFLYQPKKSHPSEQVAAQKKYPFNREG